MKLSELSPAEGSVRQAYRKGPWCRQRQRQRPAAAATRGQNKARSGGKVRVGFEGGQMLWPASPGKRGFNNIFASPWRSSTSTP